MAYEQLIIKRYFELVSDYIMKFLQKYYSLLDLLQRKLKWFKSCRGESSN